MDLERCDVCVGSGTIMGGGMMFVDCHKCLGVGKLAPIAPKVMDKDSESYKRAKDNIKKLDENMSDDEAEKILDEELGKLDNEERPKAKKKPGRPKAKK
jgi:hypothetical protein